VSIEIILRDKYRRHLQLVNYIHRIITQIIVLLIINNRSKFGRVECNTPNYVCFRFSVFTFRPFEIHILIAPNVNFRRRLKFNFPKKSFSLSTVLIGKHGLVFYTAFATNRSFVSIYSIFREVFKSEQFLSLI